MYKCMIVEDEPIERDALKLVISLNCKDVFVVAEAEDSTSAVEKFKDTRPDIVIMDINLPGKSGLETIREIIELDKNVKFIITSAYSTFEYAREAIKLGVDDYIVKPAKISNIIESLNLAINKLDCMKASKNNNIIDKLNSVKPIIESECVQLLTSANNYDDIKTLFRFLDLRLESGFAFALFIENGQRYLMEKIKTLINNLGILCIGEKVNETFIFFVFIDTENQVYKEITSYLERIIGNTIKANYNLGFGELASSFQEMNISYRQAISAISYARSSNIKIIRYPQIEELDIQEPDIENLTRKIVSALIVEDKSILSIYLEEILIYVNNIIDIEYKKDLLFRIIYKIFDELAIRFGINQIRENQKILDLVNSINEVDKLKKYLWDFACDLMAFVKEVLRYNASSNVTQAINYIQTNYMKKISLIDIAAKVNISPFYLSKLLKKHTGISFSEMISKRRIEKAIELLTTKNMSIKEITYAVGYNSQNYFTKVFVKMTGVTPSEYKANTIRK